ALASATETPGNGLYRYTATPAFPNASYNSENYWVDVVFTTGSDTTPPTISAVAASGIGTTTATIGWTTNEASDTQVEYGPTTSYGSQTTLNTALVTSHSQALSGLTTSTLYHYRVKSKDAAGNPAMSADFTFTTAADTTPPTISAVAASAITNTGATITWTTNEAADTQVEHGLTTAYGSSTALNAAFVTSHSQGLSGLSPGTLYHYRVKSKDATSNLATSGDFTFTTTTPDTTPPTISNVQATGITTSGATITWTTDEAADTQVEYGLTTAYGSSTTLNTTLVTSHSQALSGLSASTLYHYRVKSKDAAGNPATSADFTFTTAAADTTPPVISNVQATGVSGSGATITWTTDEASDSQVEYGTTTAYGSQTTLNTALVTGHSQALSGLSPSTLYHYRVTSRDAAGNPATSGDSTFTTGLAQPTTLVGDTTLKSFVDENAAGVAEAFQYTASASGTADRIYVYVDAGNAATRLVVGIYANNASDNPSTLLAQATITAPTPGGWNTVALPAGATISAGTRYWIALLGPSGVGTARFRDGASGGRAQVSSQSNLTALPATWSSGDSYSNSPMSAYAVQSQ
ncbi:MAG TPA: fibronectin type III domain-containing protein, partial [Chloroflexota bacterium]